MLTAIEKEFLHSIQTDQVSLGFMDLAKEAAGRMFGLDASKVKPEMIYNFIFKLYSKLMDNNLIPMSEKTPVLHVLNNIVNFKLAKDENRLMYFIMGEMRTVKLPDDAPLEITQSYVNMDKVILI